jgi:hypothetical protein
MVDGFVIPGPVFFRNGTGTPLIFQILQRWARYLLTPGSIPVRPERRGMKDTMAGNPPGNAGTAAVTPARRHTPHHGDGDIHPQLPKNRVWCHEENIAIPAKERDRYSGPGGTSASRNVV